ncbi:MAG: hypothetical protein JSV46_10120, partial [Candidatus Aminicenantes bacterium]
YGRDDSPESCAQRLEELTEKNKSVHTVRPIKIIDIPDDLYFFETLTGRILINHQKCPDCQTKGCVEACTPGILKIEEGKAVLSVPMVDAKKGKCTECLACEIYCKFHEQDAIFIHLPIPGLKDYRERFTKKHE